MSIATSVAHAQSKPFDYRVWQFQDASEEWVSHAIPLAAEGGMNRVQFSHQLVMDIDELLTADGQLSEQGLKIQRLAQLAHGHGLKVDLWTHELTHLPGKFREGGDARGKVILNDALWAHLTAKYSRAFELLPEVDGLVLTFAETDVTIYRDEVVAASGETLPAPAERVAKLIKVMSDVCAAHDKTLFIRTFTYHPDELQAMDDALRAIAETVEDRDHLVVMTKCVPHDWQPYYPFNPLLGKTHGLPQVVEIDLGQEFTGKSLILHEDVDYTRQVLERAARLGLVGGVARVERQPDFHALGTPNEVNLYAFGRLLEDPSLETQRLWHDWATARYGEAAAPHVIAALQLTDDITNRSLFIQRHWIADHSAPPVWNYMFDHISTQGPSGRGNAKWTQNPDDAATGEELLNPTLGTLIKVDLEKRSAIELSDLSLKYLENARPDLKEADYDELSGYLLRGGAVAVFFRHHALAALATRGAQQLATGDAAQRAQAKRMIAIADEHLAQLEPTWKEIQDQHGGYTTRKASVTSIAEEIRTRLSEAKASLEPG